MSLFSFGLGPFHLRLVLNAVSHEIFRDRERPKHFGAIRRVSGRNRLDFWCDNGVSVLPDRLIFGVLVNLTAFLGNDEKG